MSAAPREVLIAAVRAVSGISGPLEKQVPGGGWQLRFFHLADGARFLKYFADGDQRELLAAIDLLAVAAVLVGRPPTKLPWTPIACGSSFFK